MKVPTLKTSLKRGGLKHVMRKGVAELGIYLLVLFVILFTAIAINVQVEFALIVLIPVLVLVLYYIPKATSFPEKLLRRMFYIWVPLTVIWPYFLVINPGINFDIHPSRILLLVVFVIWMYNIIKSRPFQDRLRDYNELYKFFYFFIFFLLLTKFYGIFLSGAFSVSMNGFFKELTEVFIPASLALILIRTQEALQKVLATLTWVAVVVTLIALEEYRLQTTVWYAYLPDGIFATAEHIDRAMRPKIRDGAYRLQSLFAHPLSFAQYGALVLPLIFVKVFQTEKWLVRFFWISLTAAVIFVLFGSGSRSVQPALIAQVGILAIAFTIILMKRRRTNFIGWIYLLMTPIIFSVGPILVILTRRAYTGGSDHAAGSTQARSDMWALGLEKLGSSPANALFGFGHSRASDVVNWQGGISIDTYFLNILMDHGVFGFAAFILMIVMALFQAFRNWFKSNLQDHMQIALAASIAGYTVIALISSLIHILHLFYLIIALIFASALITKKGEVR